MNQRKTVLRNMALTVALGLSCAAFSACTAKAQANAGAQSPASAPPPAAAPVQPAAPATAAPAAAPAAPVATAPALPTDTNATQHEHGKGPDKEMAEGKHHGHGGPGDSGHEQAGEHHAPKAEWLDKEFALLDKNKDGAISKQEAGKRWDHLKAADADNDGKITREEFEKGHADGKLKGEEHKGEHHPDDAKGEAKAKK